MSNLDNNTPPPKCFAHHHMTPAEYGFWDVCRSLSHEKGVLFFDGRKMASRFRSVKKDTIYRLAQFLVAKGWLEVGRASTRLQDGTMSPTQYKVLSHAEWIAKHPNECFSPVSESRQVENSLSQKSVSLSQNEPQPVSESRHNLIVNLINKPDIETTPVSESRQVETDALIHRFSKRDRTTKKHLRQEAEAKAGLVPESAPVSDSRQAVRDTRLEAERLATAIVNELRTPGEKCKTEWRDAIQQLLDKGNSPDKIKKVFESATKQFPGPTVPTEGGNGFLGKWATLVSVHEYRLKEKSA